MEMVARRKELLKKNGKKGFTLVELIVVIVILGILAAIAIPALIGYIDRARNDGAVTEAATARTAMQTIVSSAYGYNGEYTPVGGTQFTVIDMTTKAFANNLTEMSNEINNLIGTTGYDLKSMNIANGGIVDGFTLVVPSGPTVTWASATGYVVTP